MVGIRLRVAEAKLQRDVGRGIARIDFDAMKSIGVTVGDDIEIKGEKVTPANVWPAYPEDQGLGLIRVDGFIRKNCGASLNEHVTIKRAQVEYAAYVKLAPWTRISVDHNFVRFVKDRLIDRPMTWGDTVLINVVDKSVVHPGMPKRNEDAKIALLDCPLEIEKTEINTEIKIRSPAAIKAFLDKETDLLRGMVEKIKETGANVVFCQKGIDYMAQHFLAKNGIMAMRRIKKSDLEKLAKATGGRIVSSLEDLNPSDLGTCDLVEERKVAEEEMVFVEGCKDSRSVAVFKWAGSKRMVPFQVVSTKPSGFVKISPNTEVDVTGEPVETFPVRVKEEDRRHLRFRCLKWAEKMYAADETWFYIQGTDKRSMDEGTIIKAARETASEGEKIVEVRVELLEKRGSIEPEGFPWAVVQPSGEIRYTYPVEWLKRSRSPKMI